MKIISARYARDLKEFMKIKEPFVPIAIKATNLKDDIIELNRVLNLYTNKKEEHVVDTD